MSATACPARRFSDTLRSIVQRWRTADLRRDEQGAVTAETALVLPSVVLIAVTLISGIGWAAQVVRCQDAAGAVARAIARGEDQQAVLALADRVAPDGAQMTVVGGPPDLITVEVVWRGSDRPLLRLLPDVRVHASADSVTAWARS